MQKEKFEPKPLTFATEEDWLKRVEDMSQEVEKAKENKRTATPDTYGPAIRLLDQKERELKALMSGQVVIIARTEEALKNIAAEAERKLMSAKTPEDYTEAIRSADQARKKLRELNE